MFNRLVLLLAFLLLGASSLAGYQWARASVAKDVYRDRLSTVQQEYAQLADQYNQAVTPKPVTELLVRDGEISVIIREGDGTTRTIETPYLADREVFVDYALIDGRLLIRRIFDENTAPSYATMIDADLVNVDWDDEAALFGKAIYRRLDDGRWVISVTGDGSLGLKRLEPGEEAELTHRPGVQEFAPVTPPTQDDIEAIGFREVWRELFSD
ncbi:MAG: hypothetical protein ACIAXF_17855 [Phycisphaerales bacterium JB063]